MLRYVVAFIGTGIVLGAVDAVWLTQIGPGIYRPTLDPVLAQDVNLQAALAFYLIYISGLLALVVVPATSWRQALTRGAMLGAMAYATYDLTNQATLKVWSTRITLLDIGWGTFLTGVSALGGYLILKWARKTFG